MRRQPGVQRVDPHEHAGARGIQHVDQPVQVTRVGHQPVARTHRKVADQVHHEREDVIQRNGRDDDLMCGAQGIGHECLELLHVGHQVAVREHGALGQARGAPGVLQEQQVAPLQHRWRKRQCGALGQGARKRGGGVQVGIHGRPRQVGCGAVAGRHGDDAVQFHTVLDGSQGRSRPCIDHHHPGSRVL